ncbi:MAG: hypothetical protein DMG97_44285 [Acidobacteria bacterium]|nr:MAG: hypothetical protein DMG97_44285 [Acidobacteriota bacterium]
MMLFLDLPGLAAIAGFCLSPNEAVRLYIVACVVLTFIRGRNLKFFARLFWWAETGLATMNQATVDWKQ